MKECASELAVTLRALPAASVLLFALHGSVLPAFTADESNVIPHRQDQPPNRPYSPLEALQRMTVPEGFTVELVASEPDIVNPIAMTFDDQGRIWITESVEYPRKAPGPGRDRVKILEDTDQDGRADRITTFADGFNIPTGVAVGYGGVWALNSPDLLFLTSKDGKEASREVIVTGFGRADAHELPSSLTWGPDGWLYGLNGVFNPSRIRSNNGKEYAFTCALWRVHPRTREFQVVCEGTSNPYGIAWDGAGSTIVEACHWANDHLFHFVESGYYQRQAGAYPPFTMKIGSITDHGHQKTAYCGIAYLDSDAYPEKYRGRIYVGNIHGGCINVDRLERDGSTYLAKAEPDLLSANDAWFMPVALKVGPDGCLYVLDWYDRYHCYQDANRDPDGIDRLNGRLYRVRYKDTPRAGQFDLASENDEGLLQRLSSSNIYFRETAQRVLTERLSDFPSARGPMKSSPVEPRAFESKLSRLLARGKTANLALDNSAPRQARLHALWTLIGSGWLDPSFHLKLLEHPEAAFRAWGVRAAGNFRNVVPPVRDRVASLARDPSPDVQLQVAIAARKIEGLDALQTLVEILTYCGQDKLIPSIVWPNLHPLLEEHAVRFVTLLNSEEIKTVTRTGRPEAPAPASNRGNRLQNSKSEVRNPKSEIPNSPALAQLMPRIIERILGARNPDATSAAALITRIAMSDPILAKECLSILSVRFSEMSESTVADLKRALHPFLEQRLAGDADDPLYLSAQLLAARLQLTRVDAGAVREKFTASDGPESVRLQALDALVAFRDPALADLLPRVFASDSKRFIARVLASLGRFEDPKLADALLAQYPRLDPELQPLAIDLLMQREPWARKLLNAVMEKKLPSGVLNANHLRKIVESNDRDALWAVEKAWGKIREERNPEREKVVAEMGQYLRSRVGDPRAGERVFKKACTQCHTIYGEGGNVGPDLTSNGRASFDQLLSNIFDPSLVIGPAYQVTTVVTQDGRNLTGLVTEDNDQRIALKMPGEGVESIPRSHVKYTRVSKLSMMPEGIEAQLDREELANLIAFLALDKRPGEPGARGIPGAPAQFAAASKSEPAREFRDPGNASKLKIEKQAKALKILFQPSGEEGWMELLTYVMDPAFRPYLHPVRDLSGQIVLTDDRPGDHPWQHGIFTGFHRVNGFNYWKEDEGRQRFVRLLDASQHGDRVAWRSLTELVDPNGTVVLEEEQAVTVHAPASQATPLDANSGITAAYSIDFDFLLRAKAQDVVFGKFSVGGLAARMPWDQTNPRHTHLNSTGLQGREAEQKRAKWCNVERPFGEATFGIAIFDHPKNPNHPSGWRVDEQGLINPVVSMLGDWSIPSGGERQFRHRILIYQGHATQNWLDRELERYAAQSP